MRVLDLFSGVGGFALGFERAVMQTVGFCEIDPFCRQVLTKHWPGVWQHDDIRTLTGELVREHCGDIDVICGGFPCQDISTLNPKAEGIRGERSGLWKEYLRVIRAVRPAIVAIENVPALTFRGLDTVLCDLAKSGFDAAWDTVPANAFGAPFQGERIFILATSDSKRFPADGFFRRESPRSASEEQNQRIRLWPGEWKPSAALPSRLRWCPNSELCRVVDGVPDRLDRYRALGNAVVPQVAEHIARAILRAEGSAGGCSTGG